MIRKRLRISGRVQGVFYRAWLMEQARASGIDGWVRNRADGSVEAVLRGASEPIETLIARCHEGPPAARVEKVVVSDEPDAEPLDGFEKRPTA